MDQPIQPINNLPMTPLVLPPDIGNTDASVLNVSGIPDLRMYRRMMALQKILGKESPQEVMRDRQLAQRVIGKLPESEKKEVFYAMNDPSNNNWGRLITAGIAGIAAPIILGQFNTEPSKLGAALQFLSIPVAALGGATVYDLINNMGSTPSRNFTYSVPVGSPNYRI